ncbi:putative short-chain dehydrogenase/reductase family protein [Aspergillus clavatus NRRL 1]|uniref:Short-chain dehydrogenase/reductase family protein, putative n=1 Tax=Aspergillus clavatus (strain ATCC 1007 / CBS 513.65 / DSM 816 / NCTC 3887 / NRRL 1 / QM 1276 / 107) TaxID=344612 RepID=A1CMN9_ASPCL|nr:short-chain dehydrogenase/reductase family protein, putative [Aspergillus clavatus NRRL 1]EAW08826.1 short-chain dehydrogenase/reductase family protein, putative [Aspergillus clavatus NRRL 1]
MPLNDLPVISKFASHAILHPLDFFSSVGPTLNELSFGLLGASFDPKRDIVDLSGKVVFVTGGNIGLGRETILQLAHHHPSRIYLGARNATKAHEAIISIQEQLPFPVDIRHIPLDLASFASIRAAVDTFTTHCDRLDVLILNAGTMGNPPATTQEGFEIQFGTNHVGHFLLTKLLLPVLQKTAAAAPDTDVRVVTVSSLANSAAPSYEVMTSTDALLAASTWARYAASKAANILFASELARRYPEILSVAIHPGAVTSNLYEHAKASDPVTKYGLAALFAFFRTVRSGALNQLWAAGVRREFLTNGAYYIPIGIHATNNKFANDADMANRFWEWTESQIAQKSAS